MLLAVSRLGPVNNIESDKMETHLNKGTDFDTTPERSPSCEYPSAHSWFTSVSISLPLHYLCLFNQQASFTFSTSFTLLLSSLSTVTVYPLLTGDSDWGKQCLILFWLCNGTCFLCAVIRFNLCREKKKTRVNPTGRLNCIVKVRFIGIQTTWGW